MTASETTSSTLALADIKVCLKHQSTSHASQYTYSTAPSVMLKGALRDDDCVIRFPMFTLASASSVQVYVSRRISHRAAKIKRWQSLLPGLGAELLEVHQCLPRKCTGILDIVADLDLNCYGLPESQSRCHSLCCERHHIASGRKHNE